MGLSIWQLKRQIAFLAAAAVWPDAPSAVLFTGGAVVSEDLEGNFAPESFASDGPPSRSLPFARVSCTGWRADDEQPRRIDVARFRLWSTAGGTAAFPSSSDATPPDTHGAGMEDGSLRDPVQPQGKSLGRSVDELIDQLLASLPNPLQFEDSVHGFQGVAEQADAMVPVAGVQVLTRALEVEVFNATVQDFYHQPRGFVASPAGGGAVNLVWQNPPLRFDTFKNVLRRGTNPNDPAPATPTSGTGIALAGNLSTTATDTGHTPGQVFNYSLFHLYSEVLQGDRVSAVLPSNPVTVT